MTEVPKRSFRVVQMTNKGKGDMGGEIDDFVVRSTSPLGAASKAGNKICRNNNIAAGCKLHLKLMEITRGSKHKEYDYVVQRVRDKNVVKYKDATGKTVQVVHRYKTETHSTRKVASRRLARKGHSKFVDALAAVMTK